MISSQQYGGSGGGPFDDSHLNISKPIIAIHIRCGSEIDAVGVVYEGETGPKTMHGGNGGRLEIFNLIQGESIVRVEGRSGNRMDQLCFVTDKNRKSPYYGGNGGGPFVSNGNGLALQYISGRCGSKLDAFQCHWFGNVDIASQATPSVMVGGGGGGPFDDSTIVNVARKIMSIDIRHGSVVDAIRVNYDGQNQTPFHGGSGGSLSTFNLDSDENIVRIEGRSGSVIDRLQFVTDKGRTSEQYGGNGGSPFSLDGGNKALKYFDGRCGSKLDALRAYWWPIEPISYLVSNMQYTLTQSQLMNADPEYAGSFFIINKSSVQQTITQSGATAYTETSTWSKSYATKTGVKTTFQTGIPFVVEGKVEVSEEFTYTYTFGDTKSTAKTTTQTVNVNVPSQRQIKVVFTAKKTTVDLPYSATIITTFSNGATKSEQIHGTYKGVCLLSLEATYEADTAIVN